METVYLPLLMWFVVYVLNTHPVYESILNKFLMNRRNTTKKSKKQKDRDIVNVDFDFYDIEDHDISTIRTLFHQLLSPISIQGFSSEKTIANLLEQITENREKCLGSTIKTEGKESDPLSVLLMVPCDYLSTISPLIQRLSSNSGKKKDIFSSKRTALLFKCHMMINTPPALAIPLYRMLLEELDNELDTFIIIVSTFTLKSSNDSNDNDIEYLYPEDEVLSRHSSHFIDLPVNISKKSEGRRLILISKSQLHNYTSDLFVTFSSD